MLPNLYEKQDCSLARALEVVGERWTLLIMRDAYYGVQRFCDLQTHLDIPRAVLADRLKTLVAHGLLERHEEPPGSGRPLYLLTDRGRALWPALHALRSWGEEFAPAPDGPRRLFTHVGCGGNVSGASVCGTCGEPVAVQDVESAPGTGLRNPGRDDVVSTWLAEPKRLCQPMEY